jgi:hypothetical protein
MLAEFNGQRQSDIAEADDPDLEVTKIESRHRK